jgi:hypothetical protein
MVQAQPPSADDTAKLVAREFGESFKPLKQFAPMALDLDNDGAEDLVVAVTAQNPLVGEAKYNYQVADPYSASFGFHDTKLLLQFPTEVQPQFLAIIHNWKAEKPKAKFVLANIPFIKLQPGILKVKKKSFVTVENIDTTGVRGATYWDGKKYKWMPIGEDIPEFEQLETAKPPQ